VKEDLKTLLFMDCAR